MKRGRGYLPVISCLLISLAQTVHAQHAPAGLPGFVPKHLQMQRVRGPMQDPRGRPRVNPFARPVAQRETRSASDGVRRASYDQPLRDHLIIVDDATALTQPLDAPVMEPLPSAEPGWDMASLDASLCNSWCPPVVWFAADYIGWTTREAECTSPGHDQCRRYATRYSGGYWENPVSRRFSAATGSTATGVRARDLRWADGFPHSAHVEFKSATPYWAKTKNPLRVARATFPFLLDPSSICGCSKKIHG